MIYGIYSIKDRLSGYLSLQLEVSEPMALRAFAYAVQQPGSMFAKFPEHYALYCLGSFDTNTGLIEYQDPQLIADAGSIPPINPSDGGALFV